MGDNKKSIVHRTDWSINLHDAMVGSVISQILVDGTPVGNVNHCYFHNITLVLDSGTELCFESDEIEARYIAGLTMYGKQDCLCVSVNDARRAIGRQVKAAWVDCTTTMFLNGEAGAKKTLRVFVDGIHLPLDIFETFSTNETDIGPAIIFEERHRE